MMKKALMALVLAFAATAFAQPAVNASSFLVLDADNSTVLADKGSDVQRPIASITKMMTAYVTLRSGLSLDEVLTVTREDVEGTKLRGKPTSTSLAVGTKLTRAEMLQLALMNSQNRAAYVLARNYPGGVAAFVHAMNDAALELGMFDTVFADPTGLTNLNVSNTQDLAKLLKAAAEMPEIQYYSTAKSLAIPFQAKRKMTTHTFGTTNRLVGMKGWEIIAQKTGYINDAGRCLMMLAVIHTRRVIIILLNSRDNNTRASDAISIKTWLEKQ